ncbi:MAG TPA: hypothetical protein VMR76_03295 [Candidatus Saccharimonadia bacterium]|nr:hypothetical protein [Candidatus Saccharimonadia bacterium]
MSYKIIVLAPSTGGKSTLMRYLREHTNLNIVETDEEVMKANNNVWPDDSLKNEVLIPNTTKQIINLSNAIYLASYIPTALLQEAKSKGFTIVLLEVSLETLLARNKNRMKVENYDDATPWLQMQLDGFDKLKSTSLIDVTIDGEASVETLAKKITKLAEG